MSRSWQWMRDSADVMLMRQQGFGSRALAMAPRAAAELVQGMMQRWKAGGLGGKRA